MNGWGTRKKSGNAGEPTLREQRMMLCENLGFAAAEAYKQLRANLMFALPDENKCRIVGVTSALSGEGKSTTSINLAYTLAETGKKVLLIDADMRMPSVAKKLAVTLKPGLSNLLAGLCTAEEATRKAYLLENWYIMPAGDIPPNPSELLGSEQMQEQLQKLSEVYDFIVIDLPPVNIVSDAMVLVRWISGLLMVVRADSTDKRALAECMRRLQLLGTKLLGFVMTDIADMPKHYKYNKKGEYLRYGYSYGLSKARAEKKQRQETHNSPAEQNNKKESL